MQLSSTIRGYKNLKKIFCKRVYKSIPKFPVTIEENISSNKEIGGELMLTNYN